MSNDQKENYLMGISVHRSKASDPSYGAWRVRACYNTRVPLPHVTPAPRRDVATMPHTSSTSQTLLCVHRSRFRWFCVNPTSDARWRKRGSLQRYIHLSVIKISMFMSSNQGLVAASGQRRPAKPSGALYILQSMTTCCTDCVMCPQAHMATLEHPRVSLCRQYAQCHIAGDSVATTACGGDLSQHKSRLGAGWLNEGGPLSTRSLHALAGS